MNDDRETIIKIAVILKNDKKTIRESFDILDKTKDFILDNCKLEPKNN